MGKLSSASKRAQVYFLLGAAAFLLSACLGGTKPRHTFRLAVMNWCFSARNPTLGYTRESSWPVLQAAYPEQVEAQITEAGVSEYRWTDQTIVLSPAASMALLEGLDCPGDMQQYAICLLWHAFVVAVDGVPSYGGVFLTPGSQAAIQYPVIHVSGDENALILTVRPFQTYSDHPFEKEEWEVPQDPRIRQLFHGLGTLTP